MKVFKSLPILLILLISLCANSNISAQEKNTEHTLKLMPDQKGQKAAIAQMAWLAGNWEGEGLGNTCQEAWSKPKAKGMMGMFQLFDNDKVTFYELCQIVPFDESLILKLKHFNGDLTGWEEKDESENFALVKIEGQTAYFEGLTYQRVDDELKVWVALEQKDGSFQEAEFTFKLMPLD